MKILLLNKNPIISKLVKLTALKLGDEFEELGEFNEQKADIIIIDSDEKLDLNALKNFCKKIIFLNKKGEKAPEDDEILSIYKPFLPTELVKLIEQAAATQGQILEEKNIEPKESEISKDEPKEPENKDSAQNAENKDESLDSGELDLSALDLENENKEEDEKTDDALNVKAVAQEKEENLEPKKDEKESLNLKEQDENFNEHDLDEVFKMSEDEKAVHMPETEEDEEMQNQKVNEVLDMDKVLKNDASNEENLPEHLPETLETEDFNSLLENLDLQDEPENEENTIAPSAENKEIKDENLKDINEKTAAQNTQKQTQKIDEKSQANKDKDELLKDFELSVENLEKEIEDKKEPQNDLSFALDDESNTNHFNENVAENSNKVLENSMNENLKEPENSKIDENLKAEKVPENDFNFSVEEQKDKDLSFDDLPKDAKFIGQNKEEQDLTKEPSPQISEQESKEFVPSTHESIKEQLKEIDEMDKAIKDKKVQEATSALKDSELDKIKERDIKIALGESVQDLPPEEDLNENLAQANHLEAIDLSQKASKNAKDKNEEIMNELGKSITSAITSSINDETLKAALKGMNMNINISINFDEDKH